MTKPGKQPRVKGNLKPASSSQFATSASLGLGAGIRQGTQWTENDTPAQHSLDPELSVILKRVTKKDTVTKLKALEELDQYLHGHQSDIPQILPLWVLLYTKLTIEVDRRVRVVANTIHGLVTKNAGKKLAPHLKDLMGPWMITQFDQSRDVAGIAKTSFETVFSEEKRTGVLVFSQENILNHITEMILYKTPETLSDARYVTKEDMAAKYHRVVSSSIYCTFYLIEKLSPEERKKCESIYTLLLKDPIFWKLLSHESAMIRKAMYSMVSGLVLTWPESSTHSNMWDAVLITTKEFPTCWLIIGKKKPALPKLCNLLKTGLNGSVGIAYPSMLALLANLPAEIRSIPTFYKDIFDSFWKGISSTMIDKSNAHIFLNSYMECAVYFITIQSKSKEEGASVVLDYLINTVLWKPYAFFFTNDNHASGHEKLVGNVHSILAKKLALLISSESVKDLMIQFWSSMNTLLTQTVIDCSATTNNSTSLDAFCFKVGMFMTHIQQELGLVSADRTEKALRETSTLARQLLIASTSSSLVDQGSATVLLSLASQLLHSYSSVILETEEHILEIVNSAKKLLVFLSQGQEGVIQPLIVFYTTLMTRVPKETAKEMWDTIVKHLDELHSQSHSKESAVCQAQALLLLLEHIKKQEEDSIDYQSSELDHMIYAYASRVFDKSDSIERVTLSEQLQGIIETIVSLSMSLSSVHSTISQKTLESILIFMESILKKLNGYQYYEEHTSLESSRDHTLQLSTSVLRVLYAGLVSIENTTYLLQSAISVQLCGELFDVMFEKQSILSETESSQTAKELASLVWETIEGVLQKDTALQKTVLNSIIERVKNTISNTSFLTSPLDSVERVKRVLSSLEKHSDFYESSLDVFLGNKEEWTRLWKSFKQQTPEFLTLAVDSNYAGLVHADIVDEDELSAVAYDVYGLSACARTALFAGEWIEDMREKTFFSNENNTNIDRDWLMVQLMMIYFACQQGLKVPHLCRLWESKVPESALGIRSFIQKMDTLYPAWIDRLSETPCNDTTVGWNQQAYNALKTSKEPTHVQGMNLFIDLIKHAFHPSERVEEETSPTDIYTTQFLVLIMSRLISKFTWSTSDVTVWINAVKAESTLLTLTGKVAILSCFKEIIGSSPLYTNLQSDLASKLSAVSNLEAFEDTQSKRKSWHLLVLLNATALKFNTFSIPVQRLMYLVTAIRKWFGSSSASALSGLDRSRVLVQVVQLLSHLSEPIQEVSGSHWNFILDQCYEWIAFSDPTTPEEMILVYHALQFYKKIADLAPESTLELSEIALEYTSKFSKVFLKTLYVEKDIGNTVVSHPRQLYQELLSDLCVEIPDTVLSEIFSFNDTASICSLLRSPTEKIQKCAYYLLQKSIAHVVQELSVQLEFNSTREEEVDSSINKNIMGYLATPPDVSNWHSTHFEEQPLHEIFGFLLSWLLMFDHFNDVTLKLKQEYTSQIKESELISLLMPVLFNIMGVGYAQEVISFDLSPWDITYYQIIGFDSTAEMSYLLLASHLYYKALKHIPSLVRGWWLECRNRQLIVGVESYTEKYFSAPIISSELDLVNRVDIKTQLGEGGDNEFTVKTLKAAQEVTAIYRIDEQDMKIVIKLPSIYPLRQIDVSGAQKVGVNDKQWRSWMLAIAAVIGSQVSFSFFH
ncbi:hypothetical protein BDF14DRAFT_1735151 [Spinellus fusiger]|nr:hypothetical protein BDF14DRAFT_1735151 [Spinellus fusiger]